MILRSSESTQSQPKNISYKCIPRPFNFPPPVKHSNLGRCECIQLALSKSANLEGTIYGFEGVDDCDQNAKSHNWRVFPMLPRARCDVSIGKHECGDHMTGELYESDVDSSSMKQSSEYNGHFTTPAESLVNSPQGDLKNESHFKHVHDGNHIDETTYKRLEELGFRRRPTLESGGLLINLNRHEPNTLKLPLTCSSDKILRKVVPKLARKKLDNDAILKPKKLLYDDCLKTQPVISRKCTRR